ncbi:MAG: PqqD family protein [Candidatus Neomarinimicrobiota bacterium]
MIYKRTEQVEWRKFENESLLLNVQTGTYFRINEVGSFIWENLDGKKTAENLINSIVRRFDVSEATARQDYQKFTEQLLQDKLIISAE